jgi:hypothetical protein
MNTAPIANAREAIALYLDELRRSLELHVGHASTIGR